MALEVDYHAIFIDQSLSNYVAEWQTVVSFCFEAIATKIPGLFFLLKRYYSIVWLYNAVASFIFESFRVLSHCNHRARPHYLFTASDLLCEVI